MAGGLKDSVIVGKYTMPWIIQRGDCVRERMQALNLPAEGFEPPTP
jgi:hypothetical protein